MDEVLDPSKYTFGLFNRDESDLMVTYAFSCVGAIIIWGAMVAIGVKIVSDVTVQAAIGIGVFAGIWAAPLFGGVAAIGIYESRKKARGEAVH